jgi:uncharacterized protein with PIN domain
VKSPVIKEIFIADRMLGKLARYLRLIGYDVTYPQPCSDAKLVAMARSQSRVLLTRDRGIMDRASALAGNPQVVHITSAEVLSQLSQLRDQGWISRVGTPRCSICNTPLHAMDPQTSRHLLPPFILASQNSFLYCPSCNMVLWEGSHWRHFRKAIEVVMPRG